MDDHVIYTNKFISSFLVCLIFLSFHISLAKTFHIVLNTNGTNGYSCLILNLREKAFSVSTLSVTLTLGFFQMPLSGGKCFNF